MRSFSWKKISSRKNLVFLLARTFSNWGFNHLSSPHVEMPPGLRELKKKKAVFLYTGLHKSLWETTGTLSALYYGGLPIPFPGMGDNLLKGKFFQNLALKAGVFVVKRPRSRRDIIKSAQMLKEYIVTFAAHGIDVLVFPEGTRKNIPDTGHYGNFFPTAFEALLEYEKNKGEIIAQRPGLLPLETYIVPFNVDYSRVREDVEITAKKGGKPRTLYIYDSLGWIRNIGDIYLSFGQPIKIADHLDKDRRDLAQFAREASLNLVKILPINVVSRAIVQAIQNNPGPQVSQLSPEQVLPHIEKTVQALKHLEDRFRQFTADEPAREILQKVAAYDRHFRKIETKRLRLFELYANYIHHYLDRAAEYSLSSTSPSTPAAPV